MSIIKKKRIGLAYRFTFGKHKGRTVEHVLDEDAGYLLWCNEEINWFILDSEVYEDATVKDAEENYYPFDEYGAGDGSYSDDPGSPRY